MIARTAFCSAHAATTNAFRLGPIPLDELTRRDRGCRTDDRDEIPSIAELDPQDTKAAFLVVKGDALDGAAEVLRTNFGRRPATSNLLQTFATHVSVHATTP